MNTPAPAPTPAPNPPPSPTGNAVTASFPTLGAVIGSAAGSLLASKFHITDPVTAGSFVTLMTGLMTALFHFLSGKIGINLD